MGDAVIIKRNADGSFGKSEPLRTAPNREKSEQVEPFARVVLQAFLRREQQKEKG